LILAYLIVICVQLIITNNKNIFLYGKITEQEQLKNTKQPKPHKQNNKNNVKEIIKIKRENNIKQIFVIDDEEVNLI